MLFQKNKDIKICFEPSSEERILPMRFPFTLATVKVEDKETFVFPVQKGVPLEQQFFQIKIPAGTKKLEITEIENVKPNPVFIPIYLKADNCFKFEINPEGTFTYHLPYCLYRVKMNGGNYSLVEENL